MKPMIKGHEYKHFFFFFLPYNLSYIYWLKVYDRARLSNQKLSRYDIAQKIKAWLNYKYETDYTRLDYIKDRVDDYDEYLDAMENEENIYYDCSDLEEELFDDYKMLIGEMDFDWHVLTGPRGATRSYKGYIHMLLCRCQKWAVYFARLVFDRRTAKGPLSKNTLFNGWKKEKWSEGHF